MTLEIKQSIFREYDIRGIAGKELTPEFAECLGKAYSLHIAKRTPVGGRKLPTVAVGWDCRLSSHSYATALVSGLTQSGIDVIQLGVCPTPLTYFSVFDLNLDGGIMITGSHNPSDYNGFKVCVGKDTIYGEQIQELYRLMTQIRDGKSNWSFHRLGQASEYPIISRYVDYLVKNVRSMKKRKVVLDAGNGTASTVAPQLFEQIGAEVIPLYCELDGRFPNHHPDPTVPENLKKLVEVVRAEKADLGLAFDGDSDRVGLVDESGRIVFGDELLVLLSRRVLKENPGATIISEVKCSNRLYNDIAAKGGKPIMWKAGHSLIKSKMKESGAVLAGEMSGHIFFADRYFGFDDAIYAALRVYEIAADTDKPISSLLADLPPAVSTPEIRVNCEEEKKFELVEETKNRIKKNFSQFKITDIDGIRVDFGDGFGLIRASNTQPVLVLRFEAPSTARLNEIRDQMESILKDAAKTIGHSPLETTGASTGH